MGAPLLSRCPLDGAPRRETRRALGRLVSAHATAPSKLSGRADGRRVSSHRHVCEHAYAPSKPAGRLDGRRCRPALLALCLVVVAAAGPAVPGQARQRRARGGVRQFVSPSSISRLVSLTRRPPLPSPTPTSRRPTARNECTRPRLQQLCASFLLGKGGNKTLLTNRLEKFSANREAWDT